MTDATDPTTDLTARIDTTKYAVTDADGNTIDGEVYEDPGHAIDARARLMADHPDGDRVTVERRVESGDAD